jgi:hypothetical protein
MERSEVARLHHLKDEKNRLKQLIAGLSLDREMLKALLIRKRTELVDGRANAAFLVENIAASQRKARGLVHLTERTPWI